MLISAYAGYYTTRCKIINITDLVLYCIWIQLLTVSHCCHGLRVYITSYSIKKWTQTLVKMFYFLSFDQIYRSLKQSLFGPNIVSPNHLLYSERATNNICKWFCTMLIFYMKPINTFPKGSLRCLNWISLFVCLFFLTVPAYAFNASALLMYMFKKFILSLLYNDVNEE